MRKEIFVGILCKNFLRFYFTYYSQGGTQMKNFTMFKLNKHTYAISGSTFVRPNWDIDNSRGRLGEEQWASRESEDHLV